MNYKDTISKNLKEFQDYEVLIDFIESYSNHDLNDLDDYIAEYTDSLIPIYYHDIVDEWKNNSDCQGLTIENEGEYQDRQDLFKNMQSDLFYYTHDRLISDYKKLMDLSK